MKVPRRQDFAAILRKWLGEKIEREP